MATVTGLTAARTLELIGATIVDAEIDGSGNLVLTTQAGATINVGAIMAGVPNASTTVTGAVELASSEETGTGTDTVRAVTPAGLASVLSGKQNADADLTAIAALTPTNDDVLQRKSGAWTNRTMADLATDLSAVGEFTETLLHNGTTYVDASGMIYVGPTDPGSVANGSIWFDTTGMV